MNKTKNMHYLYNVSYFEPLCNCETVDALKNVDFTNSNNEAFDFTYLPQSFEVTNNIRSIPGIKSFKLYTQYPGLLIGTGNSHDIAGETAIKGGFSFDYVTGLPIIPGSTLKGILRSVFPENGKNENESRMELIRDLAGNQDLNVDSLCEIIFDGGDVFVGGYPNVSVSEKIFSDDYITPHKEALAAPNPIKFLKVVPGIEYEFFFLLNDEGMAADKKLELFEKIIKIIGVGAKTNVGFGQFTDAKPAQKFAGRKMEVPVGHKLSSKPISSNKESNWERKCSKCGKTFTLQDWQIKLIASKKKLDFKECTACFKKGKH